MQGAEERPLRRISNTPQGEAIEGNAADDALMVDQGKESVLDNESYFCYRTRGVIHSKRPLKNASC
jgi:hypothetical protein